MKQEPLYKVGLWGLGYVGQAMDKLFTDYVVAKYDPNIYDLKNNQKKFKDVDLVIICVPTPTSSDGMTCDTSIVEKSISEIRKINSKAVILIKSTIPPSFVRYMKSRFGEGIVFSPEFAGESKYYTPFWKYPDPQDIRTHMWQTFGGDLKDTSFCVEVFKRKMSVDTVYWQTDIVTASLAKYIENAFFATKVTFVNEWFDIAQTYGADWNTLREVWLADPRINRNHTLVFPKDRGYGGKCFPKDVKAIISDCNKMGYEPKLMRSVHETNEKFRSEKV